MSEQPRDESGKFTAKSSSKQDTDTSGENNRDFTDVSGFDINFKPLKEESPDESKSVSIEEFEAMKQLTAQLKAERDASVKAQLLSEIEALSPHLAEKSQEKSIDSLKDILDTAREFKGVKTPPKITEADNSEPNNTGEGVIGSYNLATGEWET